MSQHLPRKRFGQHFLHDKGVIGKIIGSLSIQSNDVWIEIGPGQGALTQNLPKIMKHLYLIEIDRDLARGLDSDFSSNKNITVLNQDILKIDVSKLNKSGDMLRLVGNLPYNISTALFFHLAKYVDCISDMTFMVQKEVAERLIAAPGNKTYGRLTLSAGLRFKIVKLFDVGSGAFKPAPKVQSSMIQLKPHHSLPEKYLMDRFEMLTRIAFSKRRKTLKNSLGKLIKLETIKQASIDPQLRPEMLTSIDFLRLAELTRPDDIIRLFNKSGV